MADKKIQSGHVDITLTKAITISGAQVSSLRMREPTVGDQLAMDAAGGGDAEKEITLIANLCQVAPADLHQLTLRDYRQVQNALVGFTA